MFQFWRKRDTVKHSPPPQNDSRKNRARLGIESLEDRSVPAVVYTDTDIWDNATVTVTVDDAAPGYSGLYHWNYHVHNDSFTSGIAAFAVPVEVAGMAFNFGSSAGWTGSPGGLLGDPELVSWQAGGQPVLNIGQSADFWFTTAPTAFALTTGFVANPGLTVTSGGILAFPINAAPVPQPPPWLEVRTTTDADTSTSLTLREAIRRINDGEMDRGQVVSEIRFAQKLAGQTITLDDQLPKINKKMFINGENKNVTITRDAMQGNFRLFRVGGVELLQLPEVTISNLTLKGGGGIQGNDKVTDGGAILSYAKLVLTGCKIHDNTATYGGGVQAEGGTIAITNCEIFSNEAKFGGGIYIWEAVTAANITGGSIHNNQATGAGTSSGGGIFIFGKENALINVLGVSIYYNTATLNGGGVYVENNQLQGGSPQLLLGNNTVIYTNVTTADGSKGGGVYFGAGTLVLISGSITGNTADVGGGLYLVDGTSLYGDPSSFFIWDNTLGDINGGA